MFGRLKKTTLPDSTDTLPGRDAAVRVPEAHYVNGNPLQGPWPEGSEIATVGLGCFWGVEEIYWQMPGVYSTMVGYAGGNTPNPSYEEVCSGMTAHNEVVRVVFDPTRISYEEILIAFWEVHDPTQGMAQGNDVGTQYRSGIYVENESQRSTAEASLESYQRALFDNGGATITTEIVDAPTFYYAEDYHQQYLAKNPMGYRCHSNTGVRFPRPVA